MGDNDDEYHHPPGIGKQRYTLRHVWNAAATEKVFNYGFWINVLLDIMLESLIRFFGSFLVCVAIVLIACIAFIGFFVVLPVIGNGFTSWFYFNFLLGYIN